MYLFFFYLQFMFTFELVMVYKATAVARVEGGQASKT